ncbi:MAG: SAM-dependent methyltransferase [Ruminococcaceae bacterium]|nr:SAM-dependent methyltransferase [Oscillospiraceae bacterium]
MDNEKSEIKLDPRLLTAAKMVRADSVVADIGTDHAYLPVYLIQNGIAKFAVASDINKGPLERARQSAEKYGVTEKMRFALADGLSGVQPERDGVTDIIICGMGGELIARIIGGSDYTRRDGINLILQPMSSAYELREYMAGAGYEILDERLSRAAGKIYTCILSRYDGKKREFSPVQLLLGEKNIEKREKLFDDYAMRHKVSLEKRIAGLRMGGLDSTFEEDLVREIDELLEVR